MLYLSTDASLGCGLKEDVTGDLLQFAAMAIFSRYRWLKASEVMLFFFNFKAGFYERFYSYFDTQTIIRSFKAFLEKRALTIAVQERNMYDNIFAKYLLYLQRVFVRDTITLLVINWRSAVYRDSGM